MSHEGPGAHPTPAEAVEAGLYYFAREDFGAARKWWEYALAIDPHNVRAHECLRILGRTTGEYVGSGDVARTAAPTSADHERVTDSGAEALDDAEILPEEAPLPFASPIPFASPVPIDDDDVEADDEPTEAVARSSLGAPSGATRLRGEQSGQGGAVDLWSRPAIAQPTARPVAVGSAGSPADAWSRPATSARPQAAPMAPAGAWADRIDVSDSPRARVSEPPRAPAGAADAWSRPATGVAASSSTGRPARSEAEASPASVWSRPARPSALPAGRPVGPQPGFAPGVALSTGTSVPTLDPLDGLQIDEPVDARSWRAPAPTIEVGPPTLEAPPPEPQVGSGMRALPPIPPGARPLPVGSTRPFTGDLGPLSSPPVASGDLGKYPSMPHKAPAPDESARPSVLSFDPLGFEGSASWGAPEAAPAPPPVFVQSSRPDLAQSARPSPASSLDRWSRPSASERPEAAGPKMAPSMPWDPGDQLRIDGGIDVVDEGAARRGADGRARLDVAPHDPEWEAAMRQFATVSGPEVLGVLDPLGAATERVAPDVPLPALSRFPATADLRPMPLVGERERPVPLAEAVTGPMVSAARGTSGGLEITGRLATAAVPTPPRGHQVPVSTHDLRRATAMAGIATADLRRPGAVTADVPDAPRPAPSPVAFDPFGPPSVAPEAIEIDPGAPADVSGRGSSGPLHEVFEGSDPYPSARATAGAGASRPPSVFKSATPLPEARTFSFDLDDRAGSPSSPGSPDELSAEEIMGDPAPAKRPSSSSGDFDVIIEEPEEASSPNALAFALSAFESVSEPDMIAVAPRPSSPSLMPWDEGPAESSHVTVTQEDDDAVAELTPLPVLDRAPLFQLHGTPPPPLVSSPRGPTSDPGRAAPTPAPSGGGGGGDEPTQLFERARSRFLLHDFDGALELLERIPAHHPVHDTAKDVLAETRLRLDNIYSSKIGSLDAAPRVLLSGDQLIWLNLNHRAGFILSQIDGGVSYDDLISLSGMPRLDTLRILCTLLQEGVIGTD